MKHASIKKTILILSLCVGLQSADMQAALDLNDLKEPVAWAFLGGTALVSGGIGYLIRAAHGSSVEAEKIKQERQKEKQEHEKDMFNKRKQQELENRSHQKEEQTANAWNSITSIASEFDPVFSQLEKNQSFNITDFARQRDTSHGYYPLLSLDQQLTALTNNIESQLLFLTQEQRIQAVTIITQLNKLKGSINQTELKKEHEEKDIRKHAQHIQAQEVQCKIQENRLLQAKTEAQEQKRDKYITAGKAIHKATDTLDTIEQKVTTTITGATLALVASHTALATDMRELVNNAKNTITDKIDTAQRAILDDADGHTQQANNYRRIDGQRIERIEKNTETQLEKLGVIDEHLETINDNLHVKA